jgi:tetratricopeptide (TPR) repeat protein
MEDRMSVLHALVIAVMVVSISIPAQAQQSKPSARKSASGQPKPAPQLFYDGFEAYKADRFKDAIGLFEQGLRRDPTNALAAFYLGEAYAKTGSQAKAQQWYAASVAADPQSEVAAQARERLAGAQRGAASPIPGTEAVESINGLFACESKLAEDMWHIKTEAKFSLIDGYKWRSVEKVYSGILNQKDHYFERKKYVYQAEANLADLEPSVHAEGQLLKVSCNPTKGACFSTSIRGTATRDIPGNDGKGPQTIPWGDINENKDAKTQSYTLCSAEDAARAVKAFNHLITISGGKKSVF